MRRSLYNQKERSRNGEANKTGASFLSELAPLVSSLGAITVAFRVGVTVIVPHGHAIIDRMCDADGGISHGVPAFACEVTGAAAQPIAFRHEITEHGHDSHHHDNGAHDPAYDLHTGSSFMTEHVFVSSFLSCRATRDMVTAPRGNFSFRLLQRIHTDMKTKRCRIFLTYMSKKGTMKKRKTRRGR